MSRVIIVGAGGHAKVIADALLTAARHGAALLPIGFVDDNPALAGQIIGGLPVLGPVTAITSHPHEGVVVALGDNAARRRVVIGLRQLNESFIIARHPSAIIADAVEIGPGVMICAGAIVNTATRIGAHVILNTGSSVDHDCDNADFVHIAPGSHVGGGVTVGGGTLIGIGSTLLPGVRVGADCIVGAGAVVLHPVPDGATVIGVPARLLSRHT